MISDNEKPGDVEMRLDPSGWQRGGVRNHGVVLLRDEAPAGPQAHHRVAAAAVGDRQPHLSMASGWGVPTKIRRCHGSNS